jgi:hypothetical protein
MDEMLLILLAMLPGGQRAPTDLVSLIDAPTYFESRDVKVNVAKLAELAAREPSNAKEQIAQLLALRQLAVDAAKVKKAKEFADIRKLVEEIAAGRKANDPYGFAADYARRTARALGSDKVEIGVPPIPENYARQDALTWFPDSVKFVAAATSRLETVPDPDAGNELRTLLAKIERGRARDHLYEAADKLGNFRLDRFALAYTPDSKNERQARIYIRFTGKGDPKRLTDFIKETGRNIQVKEIKGFRGPRVTVLHDPNNPPAFAIIGDSEFIMAGYEGGNKGNLEIVEEVLAVRAGRQKSVLATPLADGLKKFSPTARGIAVGELPDELRRSFTRGPGSFRVFPKTISAEMTGGKGTSELRLQARLDNGEDATQFRDDVLRLKDGGIEFLKTAKQKIPANSPVSAKDLAGLIRTLEGIKVQAKGATVFGSVTVLPDSVRSLGLSLLLLRSRPIAEGVDPVPEATEIKEEPVKKKETKKEAPKPTDKKGASGSRPAVTPGPAPAVVREGRPVREPAIARLRN